MAASPAPAIATDGAKAEQARNALQSPRNGKPDNLKYIKGIDAAVEARLNAAGLFHFDQIAQLSNDELNALCLAMDIPGKDMTGRALEDNWKGEAAISRSVATLTIPRP